MYTIEWAFGLTVKMMGRMSKHISRYEFRTWLHALFQLPANTDLGKQHVMVQVGGLLVGDLNSHLLTSARTPL